MSEPPARRKQVLLVDDEPEILQLMQLSLRGVNADIFTAEDGQRAVEWLANHVPDLVVLDLMMPRMSGGEVYAYMQSTERLKNVRVLLASVIYSDETTIRYSALSRLPALRKPFSPAMLAERVCELLGEPLPE